MDLKMHRENKKEVWKLNNGEKVADEGDSGRTKEQDEGTGQSQWGQDEEERDKIKLIKGKVCAYV